MREIRKWLGFSTSRQHNFHLLASGHGCCAYLSSTTACLAINRRPKLLGLDPLTASNVFYATAPDLQMCCSALPYFLSTDFASCETHTKQKPTPSCRGPLLWLVHFRRCFLLPPLFRLVCSGPVFFLLFRGLALIIRRNVHQHPAFSDRDEIN